MLKIKNKFTRRIIALALSGAMIASSLTVPGLTAYAVEDNRNTPSGYSEEITDSDADNEEILAEEAAEDEGNKDTDKQNNANDENVSEETKNVEKTEVETPKADLDKEEPVKTEPVKEASDKKESVQEDSAGIDADVNTEKEEAKNTEAEEQEKDEKAEDVKAYSAPSASAKSSVWKDYEVFRGSVFGYSSDKTVTDTSRYTLENKNGDMHIVTKGGNKIASKDDGRAMYFYQVPINSTFTLKAKATINSIGGDGGNDAQAGFGLMARDDMLIDVKYDANTHTGGEGYSSNYIVAGTLRGSAESTSTDDRAKKSINSFSRVDGELKRGEALDGDKIVGAGETYDLSLTFDGTKYTCQINEYTPVEYTIALNNIDSQYQYIGMFAARKADITYSDIYLIVDGKRILDQVSTRYSVTVSKEGNGTIKTDSTSVIAGDTVTLTVTPDKGYYLDDLQLLEGTGLTTDVKIGDNNQFTMPEGNVSIKAIFKELPTEWDFENDDTLSALIEDTTGKVAGLKIDATNGTFDSRDGLAQISQGTTITVPLAGECTLTVVGENKNYTVDGKAATEAEDSFSCGGIFSKTAVITATADTAIKCIRVTSSGNEGITIPETPRKIDVWDFGAKEQSGSDYINHIKVSDWSSFSNLANGRFTVDAGDDSTIQDAEASFGDLTFCYHVNDILYSTAYTGAFNHQSGQSMRAEATHAYGDYTAAGEWYCNGTGGSGRRNVTIENVVAGDIIYAYVGVSNGVETNFYFEYLGTDGEQQDSGKVEKGDSNGVNKKLTFTAKYSGTYKIWAEADAGKPFYNRIMRYPAAVVQGSVDWDGISRDGVSIQFINDTTNAVTEAVFDSAGYVATLTPGYTYTAKLAGKDGYGFTENCKKVTVSNADGINGKTHNLVVEEKISYAFSGKVTGFVEGYDLTNLAIRLKSSNDNFILDLDEELNYNISLERNLDYAVTIEGANDYDIATDSKTINISEPTQQDITVVEKPKQSVSGKFIGSGEKALTGVDVTKLVFKNLEDDYVYKADVANDGYSVNLRRGTYIAEITADGYSTRTHVTVNNAGVTRNIFLASTDASPLNLVKDLYVNYPDKEENNFATINAALKAAKRMNPQSEADRITIHIYPGTYREQVFVNTNYITLVNDTPAQDVKLTWYYGIAYAYYSVDESGYYNEEYAYDKFEKHNAARWGCAVRVKATDFKAKNIIFENSFNRYITTEEIADGVTLSIEGTGSSISYVRKASSTENELASKNATERAAALALDTGSDRSEFYNCKFYGSQDTLYTGDGNSRAYYKNCFISGNTDYIFGDGNQVFEDCELNWQGYTSGAGGGHITAAKDTSTLGYLFYNCKITKNKTSGYTVAAGTLGRPWGAKARVTYVNTVQQTSSLIVNSGWAEMSGNKPINANYKEYNTTSADGNAISFSTSPRKDIRVTTNPIDTPKKLEAYFGEGWKPTFYDWGTEGGGQDETGSTPETGNQGETGNTPETGNQGETGNTPETGNQGETGNTPETGNQGETGNTPETGDRDESGNTPETGNQGETGNTPETGDQDESGSTPETGDQDESGSTKGEGICIIGLKSSYDYTGVKIIPDIEVWDYDIPGGKLLEPGTDYTVAYKNNVKPGTAEVTVTGKGNYAGKDVSQKFSIVETADVTENLADLKGAKIDKIDDLTYTGSARYPEFTLTQKGGSPVTYKYSENGKYARGDGAAMDINVAVSNNINKGTATILVTGEKDAKGKATSIKKTFKILAVDLTAKANEVTVDPPADVEYAVSGAVPASLTVKYGETTLKQGKDYTVKYANNKKAGTGSITITGKGNYAKKYPKLVTYNINPLDLSGLKVDAVTACEGAKAGKIKATVVDKNGTALKASQYTVKVYKEAEGDAMYDATEALTAETTIYVSVEAKDTVNLKEGSATPRAPFTVGKDISKAKFTVKKGVVKSYTGEAVTLSDDDLEVTLKGESNLVMGRDYEVAAYTNNINKGTATAVIRGIGNYSGTKTVKFKITQKSMVIRSNTNAAANFSSFVENFVNNLSN